MNTMIGWMLRGLLRQRTNTRATTTRSLAVEVLGARDLCAVNIAYNPSNGDTTITGTNARDVVKVEPVTQNGAAMHRFSVNGHAVATHPRGDLITATLYQGNDAFDAFGVSVRVVVYGGDGADTIRTGNGNDTVYAGRGNDTVRGTGGNDALHGGDGNDHLVGGAGSDWFFAGLGADTVDMRDGNARLTGDHNNAPQIGIDTILRDAFQAVTASATIVNSRTNHVRFNGGRVDLHATESDNIYNADIDGRDYGLWRDDVGPIVVNSYHLAVDAVISDGNNFTWNMLG